MKTWLLFLFVFCSYEFPALSQQKGRVEADAAAVYAKPDFDSEVIDYLSHGVTVPMSKRQFPGAGGLGLFHKIKTPSGKFGFIADTDVKAPKGSKVEPVKNGNKELPPSRKHHFEDDEPKNETPFFTRAVGASVAFVDYTEKFQGTKLHAQLPFIGFRLTGPDSLFEGPPIDFNISISPMAPKYLSAIGKGSAKGFLLLGDLDLMLPFFENKHSMVNYGLGLMWTFSNYTVQVGSEDYDSKDFRIGLELELGYAYKFSRYMIRADLKYYIEKTMYLSEMLSLQMVY